MHIWIEGPDLTVEDASTADLSALVAEGPLFWLDVEDPTDEAIAQVAEAVGLHPLAVEDSKQFGQRAKWVVYGDVAMMVMFGVENEEPLEVHFHYSPGFLITFRRSASKSLGALHRSGDLMDLTHGDPVRLLHGVLIALIDQYRVTIDAMDDELDELERQVLKATDQDQLIEIARLNRRANVLHRALAPSRDLAARSTVVENLPGADAHTATYAADVSRELQYVVADLAATSDRSLGLLGLHASFTSNTQGVASRQLAAIATVFLPITFVVGFFGMNFSVLVDDLVTGWLSFLFLALGLNALCVLVTLRLMKRRGWR